MAMSGDIKAERLTGKYNVYDWRGSGEVTLFVTKREDDNRSDRMILVEDKSGQRLAWFKLSETGAAELAHQLLNDPDSEWDEE